MLGNIERGSKFGNQVSKLRLIRPGPRAPLWAMLGAGALFGAFHLTNLGSAPTPGVPTPPSSTFVFTAFWVVNDLVTLALAVWGAWLLRPAAVLAGRADMVNLSFRA
jgi:hypothetical protein